MIPERVVCPQCRTCAADLDERGELIAEQLHVDGEGGRRMGAGKRDRLDQLNQLVKRRDECPVNHAELAAAAAPDLTLGTLTWEDEDARLAEFARAAAAVELFNDDGAVDPGAVPEGAVIDAFSDAEPDEAARAEAPLGQPQGKRSRSRKKAAAAAE